jgi:two-component system sensor histidine kinase AtoS
MPTAPALLPLDYASLELLPLGVVVVDDHGRILYYNRREEEISGRRREDVVGRNFFREVAPCTEVQAFHGRFLEAMAGSGEEVEFDFTFPFAGGPREVRITLHPFRQGPDLLCIIFVADLTGRELLRERILQGQRFSELGEVAAKVAHNFNNLLAVVQVSAQLALEDTSPQGRRQLERILGAVQDGAGLVARLRAMAQAGPGPVRERLDLNAVVAAAADYARPLAAAAAGDGRQVRLRLQKAPAPLAVLGDGGELREVFLNLMRNAIEAIPGRGQVRVRTLLEGRTAVVEVIDTGTGMDLEVQRRLFTPMFTTKSWGTGLGLASAHAAIRQHGGTISVSSQPGRGSHFRITLPAAPGEP